MTKLGLIVLTTVAVLLASVVVVTFRHGGPASADDEYRTTALSTGTYSFPSGAAQAVIAQMTTTHGDDSFSLVTVYATPPGGSEAEWLGCDNPRASGHDGTGLVAIPESEFSTGTTIRAVFETLDSSRSQQWVHQRTLVIP